MSTLEGEVVLRARAVDLGYGGGIAMVRNLNLEVRAGEIVALIGANGAGKTTTLLGLAGELPLMAGATEMFGAVTTAPMHLRCRAGLGFIPEERGIVPSLSTADNLRLGPGDPERAVELFPELAPVLTRRASLLSGGQQQMLSVGRALAAQPRVLLADEISLGLAPLVVRRILGALRGAADAGAGVLIVEQQARLALAHSDRAYVLVRGETALVGRSAELLERFDEVEALYLDIDPGNRRPSEDVALERSSRT